MNLVDYLNMQLSGATGAHTESMGDVEAYRLAYEANIPQERKGDSTVVMRDVMRTVEGSIPSLVDPFIGKDIARVESQDAQSEEAAKEHARLINYQWNKKNNPLETVETIARNLQVDGTTWVKTSWDKRGYPTVHSVPFEAVIPDPSAYSVDDLKFVIYRRKVTISEILSNPEWFGKHTLTTLQPLMPSNDTTYEAQTVSGRDDSYDSGQRAMDEIEVFEYYGEYDMKGKGITEPIVAIWSSNTLLNDFPSPYPGFSIPFDAGAYVRKSYSINGVGVGGVIGDKQETRTQLMRGILNNMNRSNNGMKFIKKGALDPTNYNRYITQEPVVELNHNHKEPLGNAIFDGNFNALPPDVYKMLADIETDEENLTGITKYAVGTDSRSLNQTATGVSIISSMSQRRLLFITQHISGLLSRVFNKWIKLNTALLDDPMLQGEFDLYVSAGTAGLEAKKGQDITSMLQSLTAMEGQIDPAITSNLIAELAESYGLDSTAKMIKESNEQQKQNQQQQGQQQQMQQQMVMQIQAEAEQAKIAKDHAIANRNNSLAQETIVDAAIKSQGGTV